MPTRYVLPAVRSNLHGHFSRGLHPAITIDPGDTVSFECLDAEWGLEPFNGQDLNRRIFPGRDPILDVGHALTGPVLIRGAHPGMTLVVRVDDIQVGDFGTTYAGGWKSPWNDRLGVSETGSLHRWTFNHAAGTARDHLGHTVTLHPFMGIYGMPPAEEGVHSTVPPRPTGGNIDCKALVAGSTLYLPIAVDGGLFSTGDGHAAQGDGEIGVTAIECPVNRVDLTFDLLDDWPFSTPVASTPSGWVAMGFHEDLDEALVIAIEAMLGLLKQLHNLDRPAALALASVAVDFHITQVVNQVKGVHAILPPGAIR